MYHHYNEYDLLFFSFMTKVRNCSIFSVPTLNLCFFYSICWLKRSKMRLLSLDEEDTLLFNCHVNRTLYTLYRDNTESFTLMWEQQVISLFQCWKLLSFGCRTVMWRVIQKFLDWVENKIYGLLLFAIPFWVIQCIQHFCHHWKHFLNWLFWNSL
jgi:hypothetical protein